MLGGVAAKLIESISRKKQNGPRERASNERHARQLLHPTGLSVPELNPTQIRVVVFKDEKGIKQPIFDSQQFSSEEGEEPCTRSLCDMRCGEQIESSLSTSSNGISPSCHSAGWSSQSSKTRRQAFLVKRQSTDSELLGEMMFGSMPMKVIGDTIKVHYIRSTDQLMLSKVFTSQQRPLTQCTLTDFTESCPLPNYSPGRTGERSFSVGPKGHGLRHISPDVSRFHSSTLSVPISSSRPIASPCTSSYNSSTTHSPPSPLSSINTLSVSSSLTRRIQRSRSTSLENASELYRKVLRPLEPHSSAGTRRKLKKYAIGFIICLSELNKPDIRHFQSFLFSHFTLIDAHLEQLKLRVEEVCNNRNQAMIESISKAYESFLQNFLSLYRAPRIESPVWLSLVSRVDKRKEVCVEFMEELASAIVEMDTKDTKYFLSSLLTAVLSHHLAWIFTVSRQHSTDNRHEKHASKSLGVLAESHPYNPLWAQLGDLFGAISSPLKVSRTIVTGRSASVVSRLLYILTYFIRCSEVEPGFSLDESSSVPYPSPSSSTTDDRTQEMKIPSSIAGTTGGDSSCYNISLLDENDVFGSRASSVTVMSEHDRHSFFSPFASPVNHRTHPFSIRTTPLSSISPGDIRKEIHSESDLTDGLYIRENETSSIRSVRKSGSLSRSGDLLTSQSSLWKHSPLLSSIAQQEESHMVYPDAHMISHDDHMTHTAVAEMTKEQQPAIMADHVHKCNCHYGNPNTCASVASCESMGLCHLEDGFLTFNPTQKPRAETEYSLSHLATCGLLGPAHSLDSTHSAPPSQTSCSSLDSGYDHSWSLTNSSRDSCPEFVSSFVMVGNNKSTPCQGQVVLGENAKISCNECDSGHESQCSSQRERRCKRVLLPDLVSRETSGRQYSEVDMRNDTSLKMYSNAVSTVRGPWRNSLLEKQMEIQFRQAHDISAHASHVQPTKVSGSLCNALGEDLTTGNLCSDNPHLSSSSNNPHHSSESSSSYNPHHSSDSSSSWDNSHHSGFHSIPVSIANPLHFKDKGESCIQTRTEREGDVPAIIKDSQIPDPMNSLFQKKLPKFTLNVEGNTEELDSPLSPEPIYMSSPPSTGFLISTDPLKPLPMQKLKNYKKMLASSGLNHAVTTSGLAIESADRDTDLSSSIDLVCSQTNEMSPSYRVLDASPNQPLSLSTSTLEYRSNSRSSTNSIPASLHPNSSLSYSSEFKPDSLSAFSSVPVLNLSPCLNSSRTYSGTNQPKNLVPSGINGLCSSFTKSLDSHSIYSESDSGCGTKSSTNTGSHSLSEFGSHSLSQISEMSYEQELKQKAIMSTHGLQHPTSSPLTQNVEMRRNISYPTFHQSQPGKEEVCSIRENRSFHDFNQLRFNGGEEEACSIGGSLSVTALNRSKLYCRDSQTCDTVSKSFNEFHGNGRQSCDLLLNGGQQEQSLGSKDTTSFENSGVSMQDAMVTKSLPSLQNSPSVLHQQLHKHDESLRMGYRPSTLSQIGNFTDVPLPDFKEYHLDTPTQGSQEEAGHHRQPIADFGHSLFVGLSPHYLPDFVLHGTTESADQALQEKLVKDLSHAVKYSIIDEPVDHGIGIIADTDTWTVKIMAASKSFQTSDVMIYGSGVCQPAKCVKQMLSSVKNMHSTRMPPDFCLSYVEDCLMSLNEQSVNLADALLEKGGDVELSEVLPRVIESLSISSADVTMLLALAAVNCRDQDMAARFNYLHMRRTIGKHFM